MKMSTLLRAALLLLACVLPARTAAQATPGAVEGVARAADGVPIPLLLVRLVPAGDLSAPARGVVSDPEGRFRFPDVAPGEYRLQVEQIGYERTQSPVLRVQPGETRVHELRGAARPIQLEAITVRAGQCLTGDRLHEDPDLEALWNEVRKGVETRRAVELQYRYTRVIRQDVRIRWRLRPASQRVQADTLVSEPDSVVVRAQRRRATQRSSGYGDGSTLRIPDEADLLEETFLADHCLEPDFEAAEGAYVIRFRPVRPRRGGAGLRGSVRVDAETYLVRRLDFEYLAGTRPYAASHVEYADVPVGSALLRLPARGSGTIRARGAASALVVRGSSDFTYTYSGFQQVRSR